MTSKPSTKSTLAVAILILLLGQLLSNGSAQAQMEGKQVQSRNPLVINLPHGRISHIPSPDGKWILVFECPNDCKERKLWIEEAASHKRRPIKDYDRNLDVSWAPNGQFFFVNDNSASTNARCYVYDATTLNEMNLEKVILTGDSGASVFLNAGHSYLRAKHWINSRALLLILDGHNDGAFPRGFTLRYRLDLNGKVEKISQHIEK